MPICYRLLRTLIFLLLAGGIPLQGFAALAMPACGRCLQHDGAQSVQPMHGAQAMPCHHHDSGTAQDHKHADQCPVCTAGAAVPGMLAATPAVPVPDVPAIEGIAYRPAFYYRLASLPLERPPLLPA